MIQIVFRTLLYGIFLGVVLGILPTVIVCKFDKTSREYINEQFRLYGIKMRW